MGTDGRPQGAGPYYMTFWRASHAQYSRDSPLMGVRWVYYQMLLFNVHILVLFRADGA